MATQTHHRALVELSLDDPRRPRKGRVDWRRALDAMQRLRSEPDDTRQALVVSEAIDPDRPERRLRRFLQTRAGRELARERRSLAEAVGDKAALESLPDGTLGHAYVEHLALHGLDPMKIVMLERQMDEERELAPDEDVVWLRERYVLMHDLWHVLSGYGADGPGETALLWFTQGQEPARSTAFLGVGASWRSHVPGGRRALLEAWRRGRSARWLTALPYEDLLAEPLDELRRALAIGPKPVWDTGLRHR